ncbi:Nn.00g117730.m01.CDS01 [Neocucurbitaria sp. VM-36]
MSSNVGNSAVYQADDQRTVPDSQIEQEKKDNRFHEGKEHSHKANDSKDERTIANKLAREEKREKEDDEPKTEEDRLRKEDATLPALSHGNKPSRGAVIDQQLREEEEEELRRKGKA